MGQSCAEATGLIGDEHGIHLFELGGQKTVKDILQMDRMARPALISHGLVPG